MNNKSESNSRTKKLAIVSFTTGLLGILSFFLMFNWSQGEFLVLPKLLLGFICLISGIISARQMMILKEIRLTDRKTLMMGFGIVIGICILLWFILTMFIHY
jgi:hypothetical protein